MRRRTGGWSNMSRPLRPGTRQTHRLRAASAVVYDGNVLGGSRCRILHYSGNFDSGLVGVRARGRSASPARDGRGGRLHMSRGAISFSFLLLFSLAAWELASSPALGRASLACAPALRASIFLGLSLAALRVELPAQAAGARLRLRRPCPSSLSGRASRVPQRLLGLRPRPWRRVRAGVLAGAGAEAVQTALRIPASRCANAAFRRVRAGRRRARASDTRATAA